MNVDSFLKVVRKYTDIIELTAEIIRSFVERIDVYKPEKVPGTRTKKHPFEFYWCSQYPGRQRKNGITYIVVSYADYFRD